jgi:hypothetical protein
MTILSAFGGSCTARLPGQCIALRTSVTEALVALALASPTRGLTEPARASLRCRRGDLNPHALAGTSPSS